MEKQNKKNGREAATQQAAPAARDKNSQPAPDQGEASTAARNSNFQPAPDQGEASTAALRIVVATADDAEFAQKASLLEAMGPIFAVLFDALTADVSGEEAERADRNQRKADVTGETEGESIVREEAGRLLLHLPPQPEDVAETARMLCFGLFGNARALEELAAWFAVMEPDWIRRGYRSGADNGIRGYYHGDYFAHWGIRMLDLAEGVLAAEPSGHAGLALTAENAADDGNDAAKEISAKDGDDSAALAKRQLVVLRDLWDKLYTPRTRRQ